MLPPAKVLLSLSVAVGASATILRGPGLDELPMPHSIMSEQGYCFNGPPDSVAAPGLCHRTAQPELYSCRQVGQGVGPAGEGPLGSSGTPVPTDLQSAKLTSFDVGPREGRTPLELIGERVSNAAAALHTRRRCSRGPRGAVYSRSHSAQEFRFLLTLATAASPSRASMASTSSPCPSCGIPSKLPRCCCFSKPLWKTSPKLM